jgi:hypothetical protein
MHLLRNSSSAADHLPENEPCIKGLYVVAKEAAFNLGVLIGNDTTPENGCDTEIHGEYCGLTRPWEEDTYRFDQILHWLDDPERPAKYK